MRRIILTTIAVSALGSFGCRSSTYYEAMDTVGYEKREMLVDRVEEARDTQIEAKQQLQTALYTLRRFESIPAGELTQLRDDLDGEVDKTEGQLNELQGDIQSVESIAQEVFDDWEAELQKYDSDELRRKSAQELEETKRNYGALISELRSTHEKLATVIAPLKDQVLFIEHAINAGETPPKSDKLDDVRQQISTLIEELEGSIDRTQRFIEQGTEAAA
jgi:hypothetical protein